jgi:RimJ/RimL family protein N-acetyltransferase
VSTVFETTNLIIRRATESEEDIALLYELWVDPRVMSMVGFPNGLNTSYEKIRNQIDKQSKTEFDCVLIVMRKDSSQLIGECKLGSPDMELVAHTDIKLLPSQWGKGYGTEIKQGLLRYLFTHTNCKEVKATPNRNNIASQEMQRKVGGEKKGEGIYHFPDNMKNRTDDVPFFVYVVTREAWEKLA